MYYYIEKPQVGDKPDTNICIRKDGNSEYVREDEPYRWCATTKDGKIEWVRPLTVITIPETVLVEGKETKITDIKFDDSRRKTSPVVIKVGDNTFLMSEFRELLRGYKCPGFYMPKSLTDVFKVEDGHLVAYHCTTGKRLIGRDSYRFATTAFDTLDFQAKFVSDTEGHIKKIGVSASFGAKFLTDLIPGMQSNGNYALEGTTITEIYEDLVVGITNYHVPTLNLEKRRKVFEEIVAVQLEETKTMLLKCIPQDVGLSIDYTYKLQPK